MLLRLVCSRSSSAARSFDRGAAPASAAWSGYGGRPVARVTRSASLFMTRSGHPIGRAKTPALKSDDAQVGQNCGTRPSFESKRVSG